MIIQCQSCSRKFIVKDNDIPKTGRTVQCGYCSVTWHQMPIVEKNIKIQKIKKVEVKESVKLEKIDHSPSVDNIKASDGKTYKFLGSQWAELLPSGKTGLFAKKKIGQELDKLTGRRKNIVKRKQKKSKRVDPTQGVDVQKKLPDIYKPKQGMGFFGYLFLIIIISFSLVGVMKTFENDFLNYFPEMKYIFEFLNEQLIYVSEAVKNIIVIINDLINSY